MPRGEIQVNLPYGAALAWQSALTRYDGPSALALSRQNLPQLSNLDVVEQIRKGGYILAELPDPVAVIVATGSELMLAMEAHRRLAEAGVPTRVVSMPCTNLFDRQTDAYQKLILPLTLPIVAVEAAHPDFWRKYVGRTGMVIGMASFGESAPAGDLYQHFKITTDKVMEAVQMLAHRAAHKSEPLGADLITAMH